MVHQGTLSQARLILRNAPDVIAGVLNGSVKFEHAVSAAKDHEDFAKSNDSKMDMGILPSLRRP